MELSQFSFRPVAFACVVALGALSASGVHAQTSLNGNSKIRVIGNKQSGKVETKGASGGVGANVVGKIDLTGSAHANAAALRNQDMRNSQVQVQGNRSEGNISSVGSTAAANSVLASGGQMQGSRAVNADNRAQNVSATGGKGHVALGAVASVDKTGRSLANSQSFEQTEVKNTRSIVSGNQADQVHSSGGSALANSVLARQSKLDNATVQSANNRASRVSANGGKGSVALGAANTNARSMAAANSVSVKDGTVGNGVRVNVSGNQATQVEASGGSAFANSVAVYNQGRVQGGTITLQKNTASNVSVKGSTNEVLGGGRSKNGILAANSVYVEGNEGTEINRATVAVRGNTATDVQADGGRVNANALAVNARGKVNGGTVLLDSNRASNISSKSSETTVMGRAVSRNVGTSQANALQVDGQMNNARVGIVRNQATNVSASKGLAAANSVAVGNDGRLDNARVRIAGNTTTRAQAENGKTALVSSLQNEGRINNADVAIQNNRMSAHAGRGDAVAASVHNRNGGRIEGGSRIQVSGNTGDVVEKGSVNSVDNHGEIHASRLTVMSNTGSVRSGGQANSVENTNTGQLRNSNVLISGNLARATNGGMVNSVKNSGEINQSTITLVGNVGATTGNGKVNSIENRGRLRGKVVIAGNQGSAAAGGTTNSVINHGDLRGTVLISGNQGTAATGGITNSVINKGNISGTVAIVGNQVVAAPAGSTLGGGGAATGVISQSVIVGGTH